MTMHQRFSLPVFRVDSVWDQYFDNSLKWRRPEKSVLVAKSPETGDSVQPSTKELAAVSSGEQQQRRTV